MRHICVIGDSSTAALKAGWAGIAADYDDVALTFFASPGDSLRSLELSGRCLTTVDDAVGAMFTMTSGGLSTIDLDDYDEFWIAGLGITPAASVEVYSDFRSEEHVDLGDDQILVSQDAFDLMVKGRILNAAAPALVQAIEHIVGPVSVICRPLPCHDIVARDTTWAAAIGDDATSLMDSFVRGTEEIAANRMSIHAQPSMLCESSLTTKPEYSLDAIALDMVSKAAPADLWHMNSTFGVEVLREMFSRDRDARHASDREPVQCGCSSLCSSEMLQRPSSPLAEYFKEVRRNYDDLRRATVVMANVTCPRVVEMVQYLAAAKEMFVLWSEPDHGDVRLPAWCRVNQWGPGEVEQGDHARQLSSMIGDRKADIMVDCKARSHTFAALSHLVDKPGRGYLAITESSPESEWSGLAAELCLDIATHHMGRRDLIVDDRHIWAPRTRSLRRADVQSLSEARPDIIDTFAPKGSGR